MRNRFARDSLSLLCPKSALRVIFIQWKGYFPILLIKSLCLIWHGCLTMQMAADTQTEMVDEIVVSNTV